LKITWIHTCKFVHRFTLKIRKGQSLLIYSTYLLWLMIHLISCLKKMHVAAVYIHIYACSKINTSKVADYSTREDPHVYKYIFCLHVLWYAHSWIPQRQ
jgi:hypothetical protein